MPGDVVATVVAGDYLYSLCAYEPGIYVEGKLVVTDISSPSNPRIVKVIELGRDPYDMCLSEDILWLAMGLNGIKGYDISFPEFPNHVADLDTNSANSDVGLAICADRQYLYLADGTEGVKIIDVSTPSAPEVKTVWTSEIEMATDIALSGQYLYVGVKNDGQYGSFARIDISNPLSPSGVFYPIGWECSFHEDFPEPRMYADASIPHSASPKAHDFFNGITCPSDLDIKDTLYIASTQNPGANVYSGSLIISDSNSPAGAAVVRTIDTGVDLLPYAVDVSGESLYVLFSDGVIESRLARYDAGTDNPGSAEYSESFSISGVSGADPEDFDLCVSGNYAFAADGKNRLTAINISNLDEMGSPVYLETPGRINAVEIAGPYAFAAGSGFYVLDISDPETGNIIHLDSFSDAVIQDIIRIGDTLYLSGEGTLFSVDISDPENPGSINTAHDFSKAESGGIASHGEDIYIVLEDNSDNYSLGLWDSGSGGASQTISGISYPGSVTISGDYALIGTTAGKLVVADIVEQDATPSFSTISTGDGRFVTDTVIAGSYAYAIGYDADHYRNGVLWIIDLDG
jgi:hypothetical protein